jgi:hypothetical protein
MGQTAHPELFGYYAATTMMITRGAVSTLPESLGHRPNHCPITPRRLP